MFRRRPAVKPLARKTTRAVVTRTSCVCGGEWKQAARKPTGEIGRQPVSGFHVALPIPFATPFLPPWAPCRGRSGVRVESWFSGFRRQSSQDVFCSGNGWRGGFRYIFLGSQIQWLLVRFLGPRGLKVPVTPLRGTAGTGRCFWVSSDPSPLFYCICS